MVAESTVAPEGTVTAEGTKGAVAHRLAHVAAEGAVAPVAPEGAVSAEGTVSTEGIAAPLLPIFSGKPETLDFLETLRKKSSQN